MSADGGFLSPPLAALLELTHRCPLQCPYCSNPLELERAKGELSTAEWQRVMDEAVELGILQVHFSGGEPAVRRDLPGLVAHAVYDGHRTARRIDGDQATAEDLPEEPPFRRDRVVIPAVL